MPSKKRKSTAHLQTEGEHTADSSSVTKQLPRIVQEVNVVNEDKNDSIVMKSAHVISMLLLTVNVHFKHLLSFEELVRMVDKIPIESVAHRASVKESLRVLLTADPHLKFFWSYLVLFKTQWRKSENAGDKLLKTKYTIQCYHYMTCVSMIYRDIEQYDSPSFLTAWLVYHKRETQIFKDFKDAYLDSTEQTDKGFFNPDEPIDNSNPYWLKNLDLITTILFPPIEIPSNIGKNITRIPLLSDDQFPSHLSEYDELHL